jgi:hypothetical protein
MIMTMLNTTTATLVTRPACPAIRDDQDHERHKHIDNHVHVHVQGCVDVCVYRTCLITSALTRLRTYASLWAFPVTCVSRSIPSLLSFLHQCQHPSISRHGNIMPILPYSFDYHLHPRFYHSSSLFEIIHFFFSPGVPFLAKQASMT